MSSIKVSIPKSVNAMTASSPTPYTQIRPSSASISLATSDSQSSSWPQFGGVVGDTHASILKEQGEARPSLQDVVGRLGQVVPTRELGDLLPHIDLKILDQGPAQRPPNIQALLRTLAIDRPLDLEQRIDPTHDLDRNWGERDFLFAGGLAARILFNVGHGKERQPRMRPAPSLPDRSRIAPSQIELVIPVIGVSLQDAGIPGQMRLRMLALAVA